MISSWLRRRGVAASLFVAPLFLSGCAARPFSVPTVPATPAPGGAAAWATVTEHCTGLRTYRAALRMSGRAGRQRIPGMTVGVAIGDGQAFALAGQVIGPPVFTLAGTPQRATLLLREGNRVVVGTPMEITAALIGVPLSPERLLQILTGCVGTGRPPLAIERAGEWLQVSVADGSIYLQERSGAAQLRAVVFDTFTVDYRRVDESGRPVQLALTTAPGATRTASIMLTLRESVLNPSLVPSLFELTVPSDASPMTVDELNEAR